MQFSFHPVVGDSNGSRDEEKGPPTLGFFSQPWPKTWPRVGLLTGVYFASKVAEWRGAVGLNGPPDGDSSPAKRSLNYRSFFFFFFFFFSSPTSKFSIQAQHVIRGFTTLLYTFSINPAQNVRQEVFLYRFYCHVINISISLEFNYHNNRMALYTRNTATTLFPFRTDRNFESCKCHTLLYIYIFLKLILIVSITA